MSPIATALFSPDLTEVSRASLESPDLPIAVDAAGVCRFASGHTRAKNSVVTALIGTSLDSAVYAEDVKLVSETHAETRAAHCNGAKPSTAGRA